MDASIQNRVEFKENKLEKEFEERAEGPCLLPQLGMQYPLVTAFREPHARPTTVAYATSPVGSRSLDPAWVRPPISATAEIPKPGSMLLASDGPWAGLTTVASATSPGGR